MKYAAPLSTLLPSQVDHRSSPLISPQKWQRAPKAKSRVANQASPPLLPMAPLQPPLSFGKLSSLGFWRLSPILLAPLSLLLSLFFPYLAPLMLVPVWA